MLNKKWILYITGLLILSSFASAVTYWQDTGNTSINGTTTSVGMSVLNAGYTEYAGDGGKIYSENVLFDNRRSIQLNTVTANWRVGPTSNTLNATYPSTFSWKMYDRGVASQRTWMRMIDDPWATQTDFGIKSTVSATDYYIQLCDGLTDITNVTRSVGWHNFSISRYNQSQFEYRLDSRTIYNISLDCNIRTNFYFESQNNGDNVSYIDIAYCDGITNSCPDMVTSDTTPPTISVVHPNGTNNININFSIYGSLSDNINNYTGTSIFTNNSIWNTNGGNTTNWYFINQSTVADGTYSINITANDSSGNQKTVIWNFTVDTTKPIIVWTVPTETNNTAITLSTTLNIQCTDNNLYQMKVNITGVNGVGTLYEKFYNMINATSQSNTDIINLTAEGKYNFTVICSDDHTDGELWGLEDFQIDKDIIAYGKWGSDEGIIISGLTLDKNGEESAPPKDFQISSTLQENKYKFNLDFTAEENTKKIRLYMTATRDNLVYRGYNTKLKGHFVFDNYYIDFEDAYEQGYNIETKKVNDHTYIIDLWKGWNTGDKISIDPEVGGLNIVTEIITGIYTSSSPFQITAKTSYNQTAILIFNATVNGTLYQTTNGTIITDVMNNSAQTFNIPISAPYFFTQTYTNTAINGNLQANLTQRFNNLSIYVNATEGWFTRTNLTFNCTYINPTPYSTTNSYIMNNTYENNSIVTVHPHLYINSSYFYDGLKFTCEACTQYQCNKTRVNYYVFNETIDSKIEMRLYDWRGTLLPNSAANFTINETDESYLGNPYTTFASYFINHSNQSFPATVRGDDRGGRNNYNYSILNITENTAYINITLSPSRLILRFYYGQNASGNRTPHAAYGTLADENHTQSITFNESYFAVQENLTEGLVYILIGTVLNNTNFTQYYEYMNDFSTTVEDDLELLNRSDWYFFVQAIDESGNELKGVKIRTYFSLTDGNTNFHRLMGQRITPDNGKTLFYTDQRANIYLRATKDGYKPYTKLFRVGDETYTTDKPLPIKMVEDTQATTLNGAWINYAPNPIVNKSAPVKAVITADDWLGVTYTTDFRIQNNIQPINKSLTYLKDDLGRYFFTLVPDEDYDSTTNSSVYLTIYEEGETDLILWKTLILPMDTKTKNEIFNLSDLTGSTATALLYITLILLCVGFSFAFKNTTIGFSTFMIGGIVLAVLNSSFTIMAGINCVYYALTVYKKTVSE